MASGDSHAASRAWMAAAKSLATAVMHTHSDRAHRLSSADFAKSAQSSYASAQERSLAWMIAACAAATRAIGTRNGEHDT